MGRTAMRLARSVPGLAVLVLAAGCTRDPQSALHAAGDGARRVEGLWWLMFWISMAIFAEVMLLLGWALWRRRRATARVRGGDALGMVTVLGVVAPFLILVLVYALGLRDLDALAAPPTKAAVTVDVVGHQWWWEIHYAGRAGAVTANEMHIPVGESVLVRLRTADVQHSFWVPQLMPKMDLIAGRTNETWLRTDRAGDYRAQCAEYCGQQHAFMALMVVAQPRADFDAWLARTAQPAPASAATAAQARGKAVFEQSSCASCHTIRGTSAVGVVGPDLTRIGSRWSIGAGAAPNDPGHLGGWIVNSQTIKPGNAMPPQPVSAQDLPDLLAYLQSLK
jgi:cytochrome c oxidase subunit 2